MRRMEWAALGRPCKVEPERIGADGGLALGGFVVAPVIALDELFGGSDARVQMLHPSAVGLVLLQLGAEEEIIGTGHGLRVHDLRLLFAGVAQGREPVYHFGFFRRCSGRPRRCGASITFSTSSSTGGGCISGTPVALESRQLLALFRQFQV